MTDAVVIALVAGVPATMAACGSVAAIIIAQLNAKRADGKADAIHVLVNSRMSAVQADLITAHLRIEHLEALISKLTNGTSHLSPTR